LSSVVVITDHVKMPGYVTVSDRCEHLTVDSGCRHDLAYHSSEISALRW